LGSITSLLLSFTPIKLGFSSQVLRLPTLQKEYESFKDYSKGWQPLQLSGDGKDFMLTNGSKQYLLRTHLFEKIFWSQVIFYINF